MLVDTQVWQVFEHQSRTMPFIKDKSFTITIHLIILCSYFFPQKKQHITLDLKGLMYAI